jgi:serine phosphatase RsbU (regulator of sigma subunit)
MASNTDINAALTRLLENDPSLETDAFPLVDDEQYHGIVSVSDLMMRISAIQENLLAELNRLSARIREEVCCASMIQQDLLPAQDCRINNQTIAARLITSTEIGGDFYDYFPIVAGRTALVIGDVSGHGVQAGMVTTAAKASLHTLAGIGLVTPTALLGGMNRAILATAHQKLLMTCIIAVTDDETRTLILGNAGHNFPYLWKRTSGTLEMLEKAGYPLGFDNDAVYTEITSRFEPGDLLILYTDGIVECTNPDGEEFGYSRLEEIIRREGHRSPSELRDMVIDAVQAFNGNAAFADDVTLLITAL